MRSLTLLIAATAFVSLLPGCDREEKRQQQEAEHAKECLDKFCEGDVEPKRNMATEVAIKLNGQWFIGPKEYGNPNFGAMSFYWPSRAPTGDPHAVARADEVKRNVVGAVDNFYDVAIEIFLGTAKQPALGKNMYQTLLEIEAKGMATEKRMLRPGLQMWRTREDGLDEVWYVATDLKEPNGDPPSIACRGADPAHARCSNGFLLMPGIHANMRFRATHGPDWPEIYLETIRILQLLRKA